MLAQIAAFIIKLGFGGVVDKGIAHLEKRMELENDHERLKTQTTIELAKEAVKETKIMADYNTAKLSHKPFWILVFLVSAPFIAWEWAVVLDSIPYTRDIFGDQQVYDLPTEPLQQAFADMVKWVFYVGSSVGAVAGISTMMKR